MCNSVCVSVVARVPLLLHGIISLIIGCILTLWGDYSVNDVRVLSEEKNGRDVSEPAVVSTSHTGPSLYNPMCFSQPTIPQIRADMCNAIHDVIPHSDLQLALFFLYGCTSQASTHG